MEESVSLNFLGVKVCPNILIIYFNLAAVTSIQNRCYEQKLNT